MVSVLIRKQQVSTDVSGFVGLHWQLPSLFFFLSRITFSVSVVTFFYPHGLTKTIKMCVNCSPAGSRFAGVFWGAWLRWSFLFPRIQGMDA